jgi:hypothetical protein
VAAVGCGEAPSGSPRDGSDTDGTYVSSVVAKTLALQELKGNIRVFCRVRPLLPNESTAVAYPKSGENLGRGIELTHNGIVTLAAILLCFLLSYLHLLENSFQ